MTSTITDRLYGESASVAIKAPCMSVSNGAPLPLVGLTTVGAYTPLTGDRILVKDQADPTTNGIYNASTGAWQRSGDFDGAYDCVQGTLIVVNVPNAGATMYQLTTANPVIGTTPLNFFLGGNLTQALFNGFLADVTFNGAATDSYSDAYFYRTAAYGGGAPGHVATCLTVQTDVTGVGVTNFEWASLSILNNYAAAGENVSNYAQANKNTAGAGPTWARVSEIRELFAVNNPTTGTIGHEIDIRANGTDANNNRIGCDVVVTKYNAAGVAAQAGYAYRVQNAGDGVSNVGFGYGFAPGMIAGVGYDASNGICTTAAFQCALNQPIIFDGPLTQHHKLVVQTGSVGLDYVVNGVLQTRLLANGGLQVGATPVVGPRNTGWNPWTGTLDNATAFNTGTVSLVQLAERVAAMQNALTVHGLLGL